MLKIWVNECLEENYISTPNIFFDNTYDEEWLKSGFAKTVIKDIDKSDLVSPECVISPVLGQIPITRIAGGTKALLLMKFDKEHIFNASACGDNCSKWILEIAKDRDLTIRLGYIMTFPRDVEFDAVIMNSGKEVHNMREFVNEFTEVS